MEPLGKIEQLMQELVNNQVMHNVIFPNINAFAKKPELENYNKMREILQYRTNLTIKNLGLDQRSFLLELLFDYYYEAIFGVHDQSKRDLLHQIKPLWHKSIYVGMPKQPQSTKEKEEIKMSSIDNKKAVQNVTYVFGKDTADMKDADYYTVIRGLEAEIKYLEGIENKPKKLIATIKEKQEAIKSIVDLMDSKE